MTTWSVTIPGQPVSWDAAYRTGRVPVRRKTGPVLNADGTQKYIHKPTKTLEAGIYQDGIVTIVQTAKPSHWDPPGQVRMIVDLFLTHDMDDDNALKLVRDAVQRATGVDDIRFLSCTRSKVVVDDPREARIVLTFSDV